MGLIPQLWGRFYLMLDGNGILQENECFRILVQQERFLPTSQNCSKVNVKLKRVFPKIT